MMQSHLTLEEQAFFAIHRGYHATRKFADSMLSPLGLTVAEYHCLRVIETTPNVLASEIRRRLMTTAPSVARIVASLELKGLLRRSRNSSDARKLNLTLSRRGKSLLARARTLAARRVRDMLPERVLKEFIANFETLLASLPSPPR